MSNLYYSPEEFGLEIVEGWIFKTISIYFTISGDTDQVNLLRESILQSIEKYNS